MSELFFTLLFTSRPIYGSIYGVAQQGTTKSLPQVVAVCTVVLTIKAFVLGLLAVRARLATGEKGFANKTESANVLLQLFKPPLIAYEWAPALAGSSAVERIERCVNNNKEFEPFLIGLMFAAMAVASPGEVGKKGVVLAEDETELVRTLAITSPRTAACSTPSS